MPRDPIWLRPLEEMLRIEAIDADRFRAVLPGFGGVTLGCATLAAARTCDDRVLHSLHAYFFRPVTPGAATDFAVERVRDGRRFALRRVKVQAGDRVLCEVVASFTAVAVGDGFQEAGIAPGTPGPDDLPTEDAIAAAEGLRLDEPGPIGGPLEWRWVGIPWRREDDVMARYLGWVRPRVALPDDRGIAVAALAFLSDYHSHFAVARKRGGPFEPFGYTSLDQALWVHRDRRWDDWWLLATDCDVAHAGRSFTRRSLYARDGELVASMAQEQLVP
jgi:acyl-CoA thioesterase II